MMLKKLFIVLSLLSGLILAGCNSGGEEIDPEDNPNAKIEAMIDGKRVVADYATATVGELYIQVISLSDYPFHSYYFYFPPNIEINKDYTFSHFGEFNATYGNTVEDVEYSAESGKIRFTRIIKNKSIEGTFEYNGVSSNGKTISVREGKLHALVKN